MSDINQTIDQIWAKYDADNSGVLEKGETEKLVKDILAKLNRSGEFTAEKFEAIFTAADKNGNGTIEKNEVEFLLQKLHEWWASCEALRDWSRVTPL